MRALYGVLALVGGLAPGFFFTRHFLNEGPGLGAFLGALWVTDPGRGFTVDLVLASLAFWIWSFREAREQGVRGWPIFVALNLGVGLCCALPAFLWAREGARARRAAAAEAAPGEGVSEAAGVGA